jgi:glycosyltransferase involved in cell wall biosynthesis
MGHPTRVVALRFDPSSRFGTYAFPVGALGDVRGPSLLKILVGGIRLLRWIQRERPRLILSTSVYDCAYLWLPSVLTRVPYVTHIHGSVFWFATDRTKYASIHRQALQTVLEASPFHAEFVPGRRQLSVRERLRVEGMARLIRAGVRRARRRFTMTRRVAWEVELLYGVPAQAQRAAYPRSLLKARISPDPVTDRRPHFLNLNRLEPRKRVDLAIRAFAALREAYPDALLSIGGTGETEPDLRRLVREMDLEDHVRFLGFVPEDRRLALTATCDVFVHPNWAEFAVAAYEPLALGVKVVWSTENEIDDDLLATGLVFPAEPTVEGFAAAMRAAFEAPPGRRDERVLDRYTWEHYFDVIHQAIDEVI